jgi:hypothetical protein
MDERKQSLTKCGEMSNVKDKNKTQRDLDRENRFLQNNISFYEDFLI